MRILGIDPGYDRIGIAVIEKAQKEKYITSTCLTTNKKDSISERIYFVGQEIAKILKEYTPDALAIEKLYFTNNQKTAMGVAEARGVIMYEAHRAGIPVYEYTPGEIKIAVTGYGKATKDMVMGMIPKLILLPHTITSDDELDAIAISITCLAREKFSTEKQKK